VTVLSGATRTQAFRAAGFSAEKAFLKGKAMPITKPPPTAAEDFRNSRRVVMSRLLRAGGLLDGRANTGIGAAAAGLAVPGLVDVRVGGLGRRGEERGGAHDLARLAVAALRHVQVAPGGLHLLADRVRGHRLDGRDLLAGGRGERRAARAHGLAVEVDRAGAAQLLAAAELRAGHAEVVAQDPEQRCARLRVDAYVLAVDGKAGSHLWPLP